MVIEDLFDMHVPSWLLRILISYLSERTMTLTFNGVTSSQRNFIVCKNKLSKCPNSECQPHSKEAHAVYVDDLAEAEAIDLKRQLVVDPVTRPFPLNFHERTHHILPSDSSLLQKQLLKVDHFSSTNHLVINEAKSKVMIFNTSKKYDFPPEFSFSNGDHLEVVPSTVLLGIRITTNLRWEENTICLYKKAMSRMWLLRRLKALNIEPKIILDFYMKEIRTLVEYCVVIWNSGLTKSQIGTLEKIQKVALKIILGDQYKSYHNARMQFMLQTLSERRHDLCVKFALKLFKSKYSNKFFTLVSSSVTTRHQKLVVESHCNTKKCYTAPHNYLARLINENKDKIQFK